MPLERKDSKKEQTAEQDAGTKGWVLVPTDEDIAELEKNRDAFSVKAIASRGRVLRTRTIFDRNDSSQPQINRSRIAKPTYKKKTSGNTTGKKSRRKTQFGSLANDTNASPTNGAVTESNHPKTVVPRSFGVFQDWFGKIHEQVRDANAVETYSKTIIDEGVEIDGDPKQFEITMTVKYIGR